MTHLRPLVLLLLLLIALPTGLAAQTAAGGSSPAETPPATTLDPVTAARNAVSAVIASCLAVARDPALCLPQDDAGRAAFDALSAEYVKQTEAAREAAEAAARSAAGKEAAEKEAARKASAEAARIVAEKEATRIAAEQEAARKAAEAARVATEKEAARVAAEKEAAHIATEKEAAQKAAEEAARNAAEEALARCVEMAGRPDAGVPVSEEVQQNVLDALAKAQPFCAKAAELLPEPGAALFHLATIAQAGARHREAVALYTRAGAAGVIPAQTRLGDYYLFGIGPIRPDIDRAISYYQTAADAGDAAAETTLALMYRLGRGVPRDPTKAVTLMRQAANAGYHFAELRLGQTYLDGEGFPGNADADLGIPDVAEAARLFRASAGQGNLAAALALATLYTTDGSGLPADPAERFRWTDFAARHGRPEAIAARAFLYEQGIGTAYDPKAAAADYVAALETGKVSLAKLRGTVNGATPNWDRQTAIALQTILRDRQLYRGPLDGVVGGGTVAGLNRLAK